MTQNSYFTANCMTRGVPAFVIRPNVAGAFRFVPGLPIRKKLKALNASIRASMR